MTKSANHVHTCHSIDTMKIASLSHDAAIQALKGQTLCVPDLTTLFSHWPPPSRNPHHAALAPLVESTIRRLAASRPSLQRRLGDDIASLASLWYPAAAAVPDRVAPLGLFAVWLVCWDDEVDAQGSDLAADYHAAQRWRAETLRVVEGVLGDGEEVVAVAGVDALNGVFVEFGRRFSEASSTVNRQRLLREAVDAMDAAAEAMLDDANGDGELKRAVEQYVDGCRSIVTGTLEFTWVSIALPIWFLKILTGA